MNLVKLDSSQRRLRSVIIGICGPQTCCARTTAAADPADGAVPRAAHVPSSEAVAGRRAHPASHVLLAPGDARRAAESDSGAGRTPEIGRDEAVHAPESGGPRRGDS